MPDLTKKNHFILVLLVTIVISMVALTFASVPLYRLFCQATGFGGTPQISQELPGVILDEKITVYFQSDTDKNLPWLFEPLQKKIEVHIGQPALIYYKAKNYAKKNITGQAVYNVTPLKAGPYFQKIECFCFQNQLLNAGQEIEMPVYFYIDPEIIKDQNLSDVKTITLSYSFFRAKEE